MSVLFDCPFCSYYKKLPDHYKGKKIKCPRCLATLTLGIPQPSTLTALPLPEEDEDEFLKTEAIEVDKMDIVCECPICYQLVNPQENECSIYKKYSQQDLSCDNKINREKVRTEYEQLDQKTKINLYLGWATLIYGVGLILGPIVIWQGLKTMPLLCNNLEMENRQRVNISILLAIIGILGSFLVLTGLALS